MVSSDSPHARGWTPRQENLYKRTCGFPARAGMDPVCSMRVFACSRIPRTRGDGPARRPRTSSAGADSPHARGWTRASRGGRGGPPGFPARAGMDLGDRRLRGLYVWIPRTRGDGPPAVPRSRGGCSDSPHARGWTQVDRRRGRRGDGFPARAGMDPRVRDGRLDHRGIPRTRGDGPAPIPTTLPASADSPHARGWT